MSAKKLPPNIEGVYEQSWQIRINRPDNILRMTKEILDAAGIVFWLGAGTCLGAIRDNNFIPWDTDIDLSSSMINIDKQTRANIANAFDKLGYIALWNMNPLADILFSLILNTLCGITVGVRMRKMNKAAYYFVPKFMVLGINFHKITGEYVGVVPGRQVPARFFKNLKEITFLNEKFYVPGPPEEYLRFLYGKGRRIPKETGWENDWRINP